MIIVGTIRESVNLASLDSKWQQKKQNPNKNTDNLTAEERQLQRFQEQADSIRESKKPAEIDAKLQAGGKLTAEEIEYLKKNDPEALKEYEEVQRERESYKKQLKNCKSKEEVEKLKMTRMGQYMSEAKTIINDPHIPKAQKYKLMKKMLKKTSAVEVEQEKFLQSLKYAKLPDEEKEAKKKGRNDNENQQGENLDATYSDVSLSDENADALEEIRKMAEGLSTSKGVSDITVSETKQDAAAQNADVTGGNIDLKI